MESVNSGGVQNDGNNEASENGPACLRVPLILRKVMEHFSDTELIKYSVVNKQWNYEARSLMKNRSDSFKFLKSCHELPLLVSYLRHMNVVPFCGLWIDMKKEDHQVPCNLLSSSENLDSTLRTILDRISGRNWTILFHKQWELGMHCPLFMLAKKVLEEFCGVLEELYLYVPRNHAKFLRQVIPHCTFPRLKVLWLSGRYSCPMKKAEREFIKTMVSRAPNLQKLNLGEDDIDLTENLLEGSSAMLECDAFDLSLNQEICEGFIGSVRFRQLHLPYISEHFNLEKFNRVFPVLLKTSHTMLYSLYLSSAFLPSFMRYAIRLENLTDLEINMNLPLEQQVPLNLVADVEKFLELLKGFDFTHIFPKLEKVQICNPGFCDKVLPSDMSQILEQGNVVWREVAPFNDRSANIKHLTLQDSGINLPLIASIFPHIETLEVARRNGPVPTLQFFKEHWANLKKFVVFET